MDGGLGNDDLVGGGGTDYVDYSGRTEDLVLTLDETANDGDQAAGETDNIHSDVEIVAGGSGSDSITGDDNGNLFIGGEGNDTLDGAGGSDTLFGDAGDDSLVGGEGDDTMQGSTGDDVYSGGEGVDTADYSDRDPAAEEGGVSFHISIDDLADDGLVTTAGQAEHDNVHTDVENVIGSQGADLITGSDADNVIDGQAGDDTIFGGIGDDALFGGEGNDSLEGEGGFDQLTGEAGNDTLNGGDDDDQFFNADGEADTLDGGAGDNDTQEEDALDTSVNVEVTTPAPVNNASLSATSLAVGEGADDTYTMGVDDTGSLTDKPAADGSTDDGGAGIQVNDVGGPTFVADAKEPIAGVMMV
jgi:Ca2+-binding RTX toxin-like protein